jgi:hypothetical protein
LTTGESFDQSQSSRATDDAVVAHVRDEIDLGSRMHATIGVQYHDVRYGDVVQPTGHPRTIVRRWDPLAGIAVRLSPGTMLRAAAFRNVNGNFIGSTIAPPTVSGFLLERNEFPTTRRTEAGFALEHTWRRLFAGVRGFQRETDVPFLAGDVSFFPETDNTTIGGVVYANWILSRSVSVFGDQQFSNLQTKANKYDRHDNVATAGVNFIHRRGVFVRLTTTMVSQQFVHSVISGLPDTTFRLLDAQASYELPRKRGTLTLRIDNLLNENFNAVIEGLSLQPWLPRRSALLTFRVRVY